MWYIMVSLVDVMQQIWRSEDSLAAETAFPRFQLKNTEPNTT